MAKTRGKILLKALELFNRDGWEQVSIRQVASEAGISHGNLCYHFSNTAALAEALYFQMVAELDDAKQPMGNPLEQMFESVKASFLIRYKYKFLVLNFSDILAQVPEIRTHYTDFHQLREEQFKQQFSLLQQQGICKPNIPDILLENLTLSYFVMSDFWIAHAEVCYTGKPSESLDYHVFHTINLIWPYLTTKGMELYRQHPFFSKYLRF